jgi:hypothetical protein
MTTDPEHDQDLTERPRTLEYIIYGIFGAIILLGIILLAISIG